MPDACPICGGSPHRFGQWSQREALGWHTCLYHCFDLGFCHIKPYTGRCPIKPIDCQRVKEALLLGNLQRMP
jgi:hypothetical protein